MPAKEEFVYRVFENVAEGYDSANRRISLGLHMRWKAAAARMLGLRSGERCLDAGCGTGDMLELLSILAPGAELVGLDLSPAMLRRARERLGGAAELKLGNALSLPFPDGSFDAAVISFALRNTAGYSLALAELARVLRAGGRLCCIDSFVPERRWVRPAYSLYFNRLMPLLGGGRALREEYRWLSESTRGFVTASRLEELMRAQGLAVTARRDFMLGASVCLCAVKEGTDEADGI